MSVRSFPLWKHVDFRNLWAAQGVSQIGNQVSMLALPLIAAITLDASAFEVGLLAAAGQAPALIFGLIAGAWLDQRRRRPVMIAADLGRAALLSLIPIAHYFDSLSMLLLAIVAFASGVLTIFFDIGYLSYVPSLIGKRDLVRANSALEATASGAQVVGPGIGGGLVGLLGGPATMLVDAASFLLSAFFIRRIEQPEPVLRAPEVRTRLTRQVRQGIHYVNTDPVLRTLLRVSMITNFFGFAFMAVYVLYLVRDLDLSSTQVGFVFAVGGVGALIGSIAATPLQERFGSGTTLIWSQLVFGASGMLVPFAVLAPSVALPLIVAAEFLQWLALLMYSVNAISLRQQRSSDAIQGRVHATFVFVARGLQPLGSLAGGVLGAVIGLPLTLVAGEIGMFVAFFLLLVSPVRRTVIMPVEFAPSPFPAE
jgi:MFS family permease